ncbi:homeodomain-interacting protein kinase 4-like [Mugil cephalus]|uniref:homeodomain-interacting protein kinase 4-like n=1 Tax=Mugil cephalus TaxID=48193 RepID=UPI001FB82DE0|nr:homeodomain-interacting protein kinase 4-like [Mugil cephalus]
MFRSLDEMKTVPAASRAGGVFTRLKTMNQKKDNVTEADERRECIELLKAMLQWDEKDRITPRDILNHPFITKSYLSSPADLKPCDEPEPTTSQDHTEYQTAVEDR